MGGVVPRELRQEQGLKKSSKGEDRKKPYLEAGWTRSSLACVRHVSSWPGER